MSIYQGNNKVLGGVSNIEENKVKEIIDNERPITTTIDRSSTDTQIPSAKAVNTSLNNKADKMKMLMSQNVNDLVNGGSYYVIEATNAPDAYGWIDVLSNSNYTIQLFYTSLTANCDMYIRRRQDGGAWGAWQRLCTTKVADVGKTFIPFTSPSNMTVYNNTERPELFGLYYMIKNGICYVDITMSIITIGEINGFVPLCNGLPKPAISYVRNAVNSWNDQTAPTLGLAINGNETQLLISAYNASSISASNSNGYFGYFISFSYPVAES